MNENEGQDLAQDMRKELLEKIRILQNLKREEKQNENIDIKYYEDCELTLGKTTLKVSIAEINEKILEENKDSKEIITYDIYMKFKGEDVLIANIDSDGKLTINKETVEKIDPENKLGLLELGENEKPDLSNLKELDGKTEKELEQELDEKEKDRPGEETIRDDEGNEDLEKVEIAKKYNLNVKQIVHINMQDEKITEDETFAGLVSWAKDKKDVYIIQGEDENTWKAIGRNSKEDGFTEIEEANKQIHGKIPDVTIERIDNDKITEVKPLAVYDIDGKSATAVVKNDFGDPEILYCRKQEGEQKYFATVVPEVAGKNTRQLDFEERAFMSSKNTSRLDLSYKADELKKARNLEERGVPSEKKGVQLEEIGGNSEQNRALRKEQIKEDLYKRLGVDKKTQGAMPGHLDYIDKKLDMQAERIKQLMEDNKDMTYEEAVKKTEPDDKRAEGGRTPEERRNRDT